MDRNNRHRRVFVEDADSDDNIIGGTLRYRSLSPDNSGYGKAPSSFSSSEGWLSSERRAWSKKRNGLGAKHYEISRNPISALPDCSTISRDSTAGEGRRKSELMALLGSKQHQGLKPSRKTFQHIYKEPSHSKWHTLRDAHRPTRFRERSEEDQVRPRNALTNVSQRRNVYSESDSDDISIVPKRRRTKSRHPKEGLVHEPVESNMDFLVGSIERFRVKSQRPRALFDNPKVDIETPTQQRPATTTRYRSQGRQFEKVKTSRAYDVGGVFYSDTARRSAHPRVSPDGPRVELRASDYNTHSSGDARPDDLKFGPYS